MKRFIIAGVAAATVAAGAFAFASSLTVNTGQVASGGSGVPACVSSVNVSYGLTYSTADKGFDVSAVRVQGLNSACLSQVMTLEATGTVSSTPETSLGEGSRVVTASDYTRSVSDGVVNATTTVTSNTAAFTASDVGKVISGTGIPGGTTITSVTNGTTAVMSNAATTSATGVALSIGSFNFTVNATGGDGVIKPAGAATTLIASSLADVHVAINGGTPAVFTLP